MEQETDTSSHDAGTRKGKQIADGDGKEAGRHDDDHTGAGRPAGGSTARDSTSINPEDEGPVDPNSPNLPPA